MRKISDIQLNELFQTSRNNSRLRTNFNYHYQLTDPLQRLLNVMQPTSFVRPHKHHNPDKREAFILLAGRAAVLEYNSQGQITDYVILSKSGRFYGVDFDANVWHSIIVLEPDTAIYEAKDGPYEPNSDKNFAPWAPNETSTDTILFEKKILKQIGIKYPFDGPKYQLFLNADKDLQQARIQNKQFQQSVLIRKLNTAANAAFDAQFFEYALKCSTEGLSLAKSNEKKDYQSIFLENIAFIHDILF